MSHNLDELAASYGIQTRYRSQLGEDITIADDARRALLRVMGVDPERAPLGQGYNDSRRGTLRATLPAALQNQRVWGITCQLYALRSDRNLGMGDFEDLARSAEIGAREGAHFLGVSPLHALFFAAPERFSPYSPSSRRFLNPLYIAVDRLDGGEQVLDEMRVASPELFDAMDGELVDYPAACARKAAALRRLFEEANPGPEFDSFLHAGGQELHDFALFEAISEHEVKAGGHPGWHNWPGDFQRSDSEAVARFAQTHRREILFHQWLQFIADRQLAEAQRRAKAAGMLIGLYLDFAVGVAPDGVATWSDPELSVRAARIGAPPDLLNSEGQDWGLAPLAPGPLSKRDYAPLKSAYAAMLKNAGALRIDHAVGLSRLWWIPSAGKPANGGFVRYPLCAMLDTVAQAANEAGALVIGEDLGTLDEGFQDAMREAGILSYRVLYFEKTSESEFLAPEAYPEQAIASVSTHDLATLVGWWGGSDIKLREQTGRQNAEDVAAARAERQRDRKGLVHALENAGVLPTYDLALLNTAGEPVPLTQELAVAVHRFVARSSSILVGVQLDDMLMSPRQPNLPGTTTEYPNWRIRSAVPLEQLSTNVDFQTFAKAMRSERPSK